MMNARPLTLLAALAVVSPSPQDPQASRAAEFEIAAGAHDLPDLVARAARFLERNILWSDYGDRKKTPSLEITIDQTLRLGPNGCEDVISSLLYSRGFALVPVDVEYDLFEVIFRTGPRREEIASRAVYRTPAEIATRGSGYLPVLTTVELEHIDARVAINALRPFFMASRSSEMQLGSAGDERTLFLQGPTCYVAQALRAVGVADRPRPEGQPVDTAESRKLHSLEERVQRLEFTVGLREQK